MCDFLLNLPELGWYSPRNNLLRLVVWTRSSACNYFGNIVCPAFRAHAISTVPAKQLNSEPA